MTVMSTRLEHVYCSRVTMCGEMRRFLSCGQCFAAVSTKSDRFALFLNAQEWTRLFSFRAIALPKENIAIIQIQIRPNRRQSAKIQGNGAMGKETAHNPEPRLITVDADDGKALSLEASPERANMLELMVAVRGHDHLARQSHVYCCIELHSRFARRRSGIGL
jgi:hypothetical protein